MFSVDDSAAMDAYVASLTDEQKRHFLVLADRRLCSESLKTYVLKAWPVVEPSNPFVDGWHVDAIIQHLEALARLEFQNLLITVPPRTAKSLLVGVFFPTWVWARHPEASFIYSSYAQSLSTRDALKSRRLIGSPWYQQRWGDKFRLAGDQNLKMRYENDKTGYRLATSVGGSLTGEGASFLLAADDPHNVIEGESDPVRESTITWWNESMTTRGNNPKTIRRLVVQQRVHAHDLAGEVMSQGDYVHLNLPMRYEADNRCFVFQTKWSDPRTEDGELLCPDRFSEAEVQTLERRLGSYAAASQLQQRPAPRGGGMIQMSWFLRIGRPQSTKRVVQSWDTANKAKEENAPWVCTTWVEYEDKAFLADVFRRRMEYPEGKKMVYELAAQWEPDVVLIEDKSSGQGLIQEIKAGNRQRAKALTKEDREVSPSHIVVVSIEPELDKVSRMQQESAVIEAGEIALPLDATWLPDFETEVTTFPNSQFKDQIDSLSQYLGWRRRTRQQFAMVKPVFTSFFRRTHVAEKLFSFDRIDGKAAFDNKRVIYRAWHAGTHRGVHCVVWGQLVERRLLIFGSLQMAGGFQNTIGYEHCELESSSLGSFVDEIKEFHHELYPLAQWTDIGTMDIDKPPHYAKQEIPRQVFSQAKLFPQAAATQDPAVLINYVDAWLEHMSKGLPGFQLSPTATVLIDAFEGGYRWKEEKGGAPADTPFNSAIWCLQSLCSRIPLKPFSAQSRPEEIIEPRVSVHQQVFGKGKAMPQWDDY